jgi:hypothetical protein
MTRAVSPTATRSPPAANVVAGVAYETVDQETIVDRLRDIALNSRHQACRRFRMPADGANVSLDD